MQMLYNFILKLLKKNGIFYKQKIFQVIVNVKLENEMLVSELTCLYIHLTTLEKWNHIFFYLYL